MDNSEFVHCPNCGGKTKTKICAGFSPPKSILIKEGGEGSNSPFISKKVIKNTGQLPKVLIQNHHAPIISREVFDTVQEETARRNAAAASTKKSAPTGLGKYSAKHALTGILVCGECGTPYRRCVWTQNDQKRPVRRCVSRLDYGKRYCKRFPTLDEKPLQQAILAAVNAVMGRKGELIDGIADAMAQELAPVPGEVMSLADIDRLRQRKPRKLHRTLQVPCRRVERRQGAVPPALCDPPDTRTNLHHGGPYLLHHGRGLLS